MCCCNQNPGYYSMTPNQYNCYYTSNNSCNCCGNNGYFGFNNCGGSNSLCLIALFALLCR